MCEMYRFWNKKINVISRKDIDHIVQHHILHSLSIAKYIRFPSGVSILDAGTGGGFPGIPLAVFFPDVRFTLVDSIAKKIRIVKDIVGSLRLTNVKPVCARVESLPGIFDFVTGRAVTDPTRFHALVNRKITPGGTEKLVNGMLYLTGGDLPDSLLKLTPDISIIDLSGYFSDPYFTGKKLIHIRKT